MASLQVRTRWDRMRATDYEDTSYGKHISAVNRRYQPMSGNFNSKQSGICFQHSNSPPSSLKRPPRSNEHSSIHKRSITINSVSNEPPNWSDYIRGTPRVGISKSKRVISQNGHQYHTYDSNENLINYSADGAFEAPTRGVRFQTLEDKVIRFIRREQDERRFDKIMSYVKRIRSRANANREDEVSENLKRAIRGKSAGQITHAILAESERNLHGAKNWQNVEVETEQHHHHHQRRGVSEARIVKRVTHVDLLDERAIDQLNCNVASSLNDVKRQLQCLNQRTVDIYHDSRLRKNKLH